MRIADSVPRVVGPHHCHDGVAYERPAVMPEDPAIKAGGQYERAYVRKGRARGVSWQHLARQLGVAETGLRDQHQAVTG